MSYKFTISSILNMQRETSATYNMLIGATFPTSTCSLGHHLVKTGLWLVFNWGGAEGSGTRSSLIWCVKEAVRIKRPKYVVLENVKNLVGKRFRPYFDHWLELLESYGYKNFWKVINAADCGVPQSRERVFCVSVMRTKDNPDPQFFFPRPIPLEECILDRLDPKGSVDEKYWLSEKAVEYYERVDADKSHNHNFTRKKKTDIAFTIRTKPGTRVDDNYIIDHDEPKNSV